MSRKDHIGDLACQALKILTNFDEQSLLLSSQADCIIHPMVKQIIFMNILSQMKPLLVNNGSIDKIKELKSIVCFPIELSSNQMSVLVDLLSNVPKSIIQDEIISV
jgi:hypothetical protein